MRKPCEQLLDPPSSSGIELEPSPKRYSREQDKARPPAQTVEWVRERFKASGLELLSRCERIDTGRLGIPVYASFCAPAATALTGTQKQMGKGASPVQAEASALMELAERVSFFHFIRCHRWKRVRVQELTGPAMDLAEAAKAVGHPPEDMARATAAIALLPQRWCWARQLASGEQRLIPLDWFYAINEYNGPAAGNTQPEAIVQALCEVVERHVCAVVTHQRMCTPEIDPASITDPIAVELLKKYKAAGVQVVLRDYTLGMGIPSVAALAWDPSTFPHSSEIVYAAGTATSPAKALIRALTEVAQLAGDFCRATSYLTSALPKFSTLEEAHYVLEPAGRVGLDELPSVAREDFTQEIAACTEALAAKGLSVWAINTTHPRLQVPAVYVIVPGAQFAERTTGTDAFFHTASLAARLEPSEALSVLCGLEEITGPTYYTAFFRAVALNALGQSEQALEALSLAESLGVPQRELGGVIAQKAEALKNLGRYEQALEITAKAESLPEPHPELFNIKGACLFALARYPEAMEAFARAVELDPGQAINYANIGSCLRRMGLMAEAKQMYLSALEIDPTLEIAHQGLMLINNPPD